MSNNVYTEYVFKNPDYEHAMTELQAILFNVSVRNQALLKSIRSYDFSQNSEEIRREAKKLYKQDDACSNKLLNMTFDLTEYLKKLDSYSAVFDDLKTRSMKELITGLQTRNNLAEMENEAIPYVPEADISQEEFLKNMSNTQQTNNEEYLIDPATNQPYWVDPKTGESYWVDPANGKPYYVDEATGQAFYLEPDTTTVQDVATQTSLASEEPVITEIKNVSDEPVITAVEDVETAEPVITSTTTISEDSKTKEKVDDKTVSVPTDAKPTEGTSKEEDVVMEYDDSLSKVVDETGTVTQEENPENKTTTDAKPAEGTSEEEDVVMEYDDSLSKVVDETGTVTQEENPENKTTTDAKPAEGTSEEEDVVMEYDDSLSKVVDETGTVTQEENPDNKTTTDEKPAEGTSVEEDILMEYDDSLSKVVDETGAGTQEENSEDKTTADAKSNDNTATAEVTEEKKEEPAEEKKEESVEEKKEEPVDGKKEEPVEDKKEETEEKSTALIEPEEVEKPVEVSAEGENAVIEVVPNDNSVIEEVKASSPVDATSAPLIPVEDTGSVISTDGAKKEDEVVDLNSVVPTIPDPMGLSSDETKEEATEEITSNDSSDKLTFTKVNNDPTKAILTSKSQITKLRASGSTQEALLNGKGFFEKDFEQQLVDNGLLEPSEENIEAELERMLEQANQLYKDGKPEEAQAMYNKISEINKKRQEQKTQQEQETDEGYAYQMAA